MWKGKKGIQITCLKISAGNAKEYISKNVFLETTTSGESIHLTTQMEKYHTSGKLYFKMLISLSGITHLFGIKN